MSHFAELDDNNIVLRVIVADNNLPNEGYDWVVENLGGRWVQTSYNGNFRGRFAGIGDTYNEEEDRFEPSQPYASWIWNEASYAWEPPIPYPTDGNDYQWNEELDNWSLIGPEA